MMEIADARLGSFAGGRQLGSFDGRISVRDLSFCEDGLFHRRHKIGPGCWEGQDVVSVVFVIGMFNLAVGFAVALVLERRVVVYLPSFRSASGNAGSIVSENFPPTWLEKLEEGNFEISTLIEASAHVIRLEVNIYLEQLLDVEDQIWKIVDQENDEELPDAAASLIAVNDDWLAKQADAIRVLKDQGEELGEYASKGAQIEKELARQMPLLEKHLAALKGVDPTHGASVLEPIMREVSELVGLAHQLRDVMLNTIAFVMREEGKLDTVESENHRDELTGLEGRLGIELLFHNWWRDDPERSRVTSVTLIDLDKFSETNERCTTRVGDRVI